MYDLITGFIAGFVVAGVTLLSLWRTPDALRVRQIKAAGLQPPKGFEDHTGPKIREGLSEIVWVTEKKKEKGK